MRERSPMPAAVKPASRVTARTSGTAKASGKGTEGGHVASDVEITTAFRAVYPAPVSVEQLTSELCKVWPRTTTEQVRAIVKKLHRDKWVKLVKVPGVAGEWYRLCSERLPDPADAAARDFSKPDPDFERQIVEYLTSQEDHDGYGEAHDGSRFQEIPNGEKNPEDFDEYIKTSDEHKIMIVASDQYDLSPWYAGPRLSRIIRILEKAKGGIADVRELGPR